MVRERRRSQVEWSQRVRRFNRSGLTLEEFARQEGVSPGQLAWWTGRLRSLRASNRQTAPAFVELVPAQAPAPAGIELVLAGGLVMRVPVGFDETTVARLVRTLGGTCA